jgi:hypothetical protein
VAKSREIYESMMDQEELEEADLGGDAADDLIDNVEMDEESDISMEGEEEDEFGGDDMGGDDMGGDDMGGDDMGGDDMGDDMGGSSEAATKDDIMNLEDKLDQLMADFENLMADGGDDMGDGDNFGPEEGGDAIEMDDTEEMGMMEALQLKAAPKPVTSEEGATNKKSTVAANSGARGAMAKPVSTGTSLGGSHDSAAYRNTVKDLGTTPTQDAGKGAFRTAAPKPTTTQASGVNNKSPLPSGRG